eukprot:CAMPEP_0174321258 /NCGR_PEP_ID=MMETSP0810-20121108/10150_1 /TAXON_ID=73025 ORGANISM="Eutreptiella gymnastica-like, Strain CCMP1594" /NCGR_SAMPLE_ID=MMETSP0810 /ASSEMBLY_ACC=CAM_ASM_000659 /LENGTH=367 /DNA_ID=CAMNT_0015432551 /DNA_START=282 /DNA_END=1384 /DNA_ORIENTATION=-
MYTACAGGGGVHSPGPEMAGAGLWDADVECGPLPPRGTVCGRQRSEQRGASGTMPPAPSAVTREGPPDNYTAREGPVLPRSRDLRTAEVHLPGPGQTSLPPARQRGAPGPLEDVVLGAGHVRRPAVGPQPRACPEVGPQHELPVAARSVRVRPGPHAPRVAAGEAPARAVRREPVRVRPRVLRVVRQPLEDRRPRPPAVARAPAARAPLRGGPARRGPGLQRRGGGHRGVPPHLPRAGLGARVALQTVEVRVRVLRGLAGLARDLRGRRGLGLVGGGQRRGRLEGPAPAGGLGLGRVPPGGLLRGPAGGLDGGQGVRSGAGAVVRQVLPHAREDGLLVVRRELIRGDRVGEGLHKSRHAARDEGEKK